MSRITLPPSVGFVIPSESRASLQVAWKLPCKLEACVPLPAMSDRLDDYDFALPDRLIAQRPAARREDARMMVLDRREETIAHRRFADLPDFVRPRRASRP